MKIKATRTHGRVRGGLTYPRGARYGRARKKLLLTSSRLTALKPGKKPASRAASAGDVIPAFFESIAGPHPELPKTISGSLRFELKDGNRSEYWRVTITKGVASCAHSKAPADCVVHTDKATFEAIVQGRANPMAAVLRGAVRVEGEALLMAYFRSLFTHPAAVHEAQLLAKNTGRAS